jgi:hypothetical protein
MLAVKSGVVSYKKYYSKGKLVKSCSLPSIVAAPYEIWTADNTYMEYLDFEGNTTRMTVSQLNLLLANAIGDNSIAVTATKYGTLETIPLASNEVFECESLRKIVAIDSSGKPRIICKADYVSQSTLKPIHDAVFRMLYDLESDHAHKHDEGFDILQEFMKRDDDFEVASLDLSGATDYFPAWFQIKVVEYIWGPKLAEIWGNAMVRVPVQDGYYYRIGQPMGTYSSWAVFALSHHVLVHLAAWRIRNEDSRWTKLISRQPGELYHIVGDDVYVAQTPLINSYQITMNEAGVKINKDKSFFTGGRLRQGEFVKRNSWRGFEVSALSPRLIIKAFTDYTSAHQLIRKLLMLGYPKKSLDKLVKLLLCGAPRGQKSSMATAHVINQMTQIPFQLNGLALDNPVCLDNNIIMAAIMGVVKSHIYATERLPYFSNPGKLNWTEFAEMCFIDVPGLASTREIPLHEYLRSIPQDVVGEYNRYALQQFISDKWEEHASGTLDVSFEALESLMSTIKSLISVPSLPSWSDNERKLFMVKFVKEIKACNGDVNKIEQRYTRLASSITGSNQLQTFEGLLRHLEFMEMRNDDAISGRESREVTVSKAAKKPMVQCS